MADTYLTIKSCSEGIYKEKGSKFLAFAFPVNNKEEIKDILQTYRKQYYDARHVCYAYMLGAERTDFRSNDDGEPSGTAGKPILGQINSHNLTNILIIVIRYFGGILLGTGGLIVAYRQAAADAINAAEEIEKTVDFGYSLLFGYENMNSIMRIIKEENATITDNRYAEADCILDLYVCKANRNTLVAKLQKIDGIKITEREL